MNNKFEFIFDGFGDINEIYYYEEDTGGYEFTFSDNDAKRFYNILCKNCKRNKKYDLGWNYLHEFYDVDYDIIKEMLLCAKNSNELSDIWDFIKRNEKYRKIAQKGNPDKAVSVSRNTKNSQKGNVYIGEDIDVIPPKEKKIDPNDPNIQDVIFYDRVGVDDEGVDEDEYSFDSGDDFDNLFRDDEKVKKEMTEGIRKGNEETDAHLFFKHMDLIRNKNINRAKRNKKRIIIVSAALAATLVAFSIGKSIKKNRDAKAVVIEEPVITVKNADNSVVKTTNKIDYELVEELKSKSTPIDYDVLSLNTDNCIYESKFKMASSSYYGIIRKYSQIYGIDSNLLLAICTHERGTHSTEIDSGGGMGLFQIQLEGDFYWTEVTAYNFLTESYETCKITKESISDVDENIKIGAMIVQNTFKEQNYDIPKAIQAYNYGTGNMQEVLRQCKDNEKLTDEEINDPYNLTWLKYRDVISGGDPNYLENVFKYIPDGTELHIKKPDGSTVDFIYDNLNCDDYVRKQ